MTLKLNGEAREFESGQDVMPLSKLLAQLGFAEIPVLVEHNGVALRPREHADRKVADGDQLEIIRIVAGG